MQLFIVFLLLALGILLVAKGGDWFVDSASWFAEISGVPPLVIGATIVSLATTLPEMIVSSLAAYKGQVDLAICNAIGSVSANLGLGMALGILGLPQIIKRKDYLVKGVLMLLAILTLFLGCRDDLKLHALPALLLLVIFIAAVSDSLFHALRNIRSTPTDPATTPKEKATPRKIAFNIGRFIVGIACIVWGADLMVDNGVIIAQRLGISERIIGLTFMAIGTSLPELVTSITALVKRKSELSIGNVIGANIIDMTLILPISRLITGGDLPVNQQNAYVDLPVTLGLGLIALAPSLIKGRFYRWQGALMLIGYLAYMVATCLVTF